MIRQYGNLIQNKKIGVLGYGNIGKNFKRLILSFNPKKFMFMTNIFKFLKHQNFRPDTS